MTTTHDEDLARPPFSIVASLEPARVGAEIVACFERIGARRDRLQQAHALAMQSIGIGASAPLCRAGAAIARAIDHGTGAGLEGGYHNGRHFLEVMLCALYLSRLALLDRDRSARVVTAALIHDFHHDGSRSSESPFRLEDLAATSADRYLNDEGVAQTLREQIHALVLATETSIGVPFARACQAARAAPAARAAAPSAADLPWPLRQLLVDPELAFEAVLLAEADVLPSIGLTVAHGHHIQDCLAAEWNTSLGAKDKLAFVEQVRGNITVASFFTPNIEALRKAYLQRLPPVDPGDADPGDADPGGSSSDDRVGKR